MKTHLQTQVFLLKMAKRKTYKEKKETINIGALEAGDRGGFRPMDSGCSGFRISRIFDLSRLSRHRHVEGSGFPRTRLPRKCRRPHGQRRDLAPEVRDLAPELRGLAREVRGLAPKLCGKIRRGRHAGPTLGSRIADGLVYNFIPAPGMPAAHLMRKRCPFLAN